MPAGHGVPSFRGLGAALLRLPLCLRTRAPRLERRAKLRRKGCTFLPRREASAAVWPNELAEPAARRAEMGRGRTHVEFGTQLSDDPRRPRPVRSWPRP